ncbi:MAG: isoaspartyl peptidase/L-asparaginase family protein [Candidatus Kapaibacteriales bacterium]
MINAQAILFLYLIFRLSLWALCQDSSQIKSFYAIVIHGGAGTYRLSRDEEIAYQDKLEEALDSGFTILQNGGSSVSAVESAIRVMEASPLFNAGLGSVLNEDGIVEMDASIMEGSELKAGAVAGIKSYLHPISIARLVMEKTPHVLLAGEGAERFALSMGFQPILADSLITPKALQEWKSRKESRKGTVGAVAIDRYGIISAGTSTGGMMMKMAGRIGDSPIIGAGTYANNYTCGISCTGWGEYFIKQSAAFQISMLMETKNFSLSQAIKEVLQKLKQMGATGGIIGIDKFGNVCTDFTTEAMPRAFRTSDGRKKILINRE